MAAQDEYQATPPTAIAPPLPRFRRRALWASAALAVALPSLAAQPWPPTDAQVLRDRPGATLAQRLDADLDADGKPETILVLAYADAPDQDAFRTVEILWKHRATTGPGSDEDDEEPNNQLTLPSSPHGPPHVAVKNGVLVVEDLTGGTTAIQATYRYRYDKQADDLRLIGLDAERYSRTGAHGSLRLSWNVVTGARIVQRSTVGPDGALRFGPEQRSTDKTRTYYYIADTPDPESLLDALR